ncbi:carbohydrate ABC transporter permease [Glaciibacter psychrotolerans]|uniref:Raffinose/stachyose/melibiose transport system permease protein n=1 Tax=Glaciibacter psychrotolerans TaxID=670054 RepID=A0A7Z0J4H0_9MICO|nr:sugar ABC transporter permease [Leifsonia psychrotolerans]NYJ18382.1 raffinose/stachyose/melibiose transport system permease protein [Leifsonia psychrotolerans]
MKKKWALAPYLFLAPALLVFGFAVLLPVVNTVGYSFTTWNGYGEKIFVGFDNYIAAINDATFRASFVHVIGYIALTLVLEVAVGLVLAGLVGGIRRGSLWFRVAIFTPVMLPMVVVAVLWAFVYNADFGLLNAALETFGLAEFQRVWLGDTSTALIAISVVSGWVYAGFYMTIFYAAFSQVPGDVIEAARLDGAGELRIFRSVKVPMIRNAVIVAVLLCVTGGFQSFDLFYVMTNGGPYGATEIPTTYLVKTVFSFGKVGYGSAMAVLLTAVIVGFGLVFVRLTGRRREGGRP